MCMIFGQLSNRDCRCDLLVCLTAHKTKHYHLGVGKIFQDLIWQQQTRKEIANFLKCCPMN